MKANGVLYQQARTFRKNPTKSEHRLWQALRKNPYSYKFRRQHPIGHFIVDVYYPAARLVIEVDGTIHDTRQEYDQERTNIL